MRLLLLPSNGMDENNPLLVSYSYFRARQRMLAALLTVSQNIIFTKEVEIYESAV